MAFPSRTQIRLQQERRDTFLATGTVTRYFHSSQIRYIDVFVVGAGGSGGTQNNGGSTTVVHGGSGGGVGAFRMDLLKVCDLFNSGRHMVFTVTTAIGTGGTAVTCSVSAGVLIVGNAGGISSVTVKGTTRSGTSVGAIFKATGER